MRASDVARTRSPTPESESISRRDKTKIAGKKAYKGTPEMDCFARLKNNNKEEKRHVHIPIARKHACSRGDYERLRQWPYNVPSRSSQSCKPFELGSSRLNNIKLIVTLLFDYSLPSNSGDGVLERACAQLQSERVIALRDLLRKRPAADAERIFIDREDRQELKPRVFLPTHFFCCEGRDARIKAIPVT